MARMVEPPTDYVERARKAKKPTKAAVIDKKKKTKVAAAEKKPRYRRG